MFRRKKPSVQRAAHTILKPLRNRRSIMRPTQETPRSRRRRRTNPPTETTKEHHQKEVAAIEKGLKLLDIYTSALKELKERGHDAANDIKLALDGRHAPRDWSNAEILSVMSDVIDEHPRPGLEFVLGVLGLSKVSDGLNERLRSQGAKAYAVGVRTRALWKKKEAKEKEERERREKKEREEREKREKEEKERLEREKAEEEQRKAQEERRKAEQRKENEAKRGRGRGRRGRRGRPPSRVVATERARKIDADQQGAIAKMVAEPIPKPVPAAVAKEVERDLSKLTAGAETTRDQEPNLRLNRTGTSVPPAIAVYRQGQKESKSISARSTPTTVSTRTQMAVETFANVADASKDTRTRTHAKEKGDEMTTRSKNVTNVNDRPDSITMLDPKKTERSSGPPEKTATEKLKVSVTHSPVAATNLDKRAAITATDGQITKPTKALDRIRPLRPGAVANGKPGIANGGAMQSERPARASAVAPTVATAPPQMIPESEIASALKASAAAVTGEAAQSQINPSVPTKAVADVGEDTTGRELQNSKEKASPASKEVERLERKTPDEKRGNISKEPDLTRQAVKSETKSLTTKDDVEAIADNTTEQSKDVKEPIQTRSGTKKEKETFESGHKLATTKDRSDVVPNKTTTRSKAGKDPVQSRPITRRQKETVEDAKIFEEKGDVANFVKRPVDKPTEKGTGREATADKRREETVAEKVDTVEKEGKPTVDAEKANDPSEEKDEELKADEEMEEKATEAEEAEDLMGDVFGPDDGDAEKDETETDQDKRARRYSSRRRQSYDEDEDETETTATVRRSKAGESEEEAQLKEKKKRGRPKGSVRRVSRRLSNIHDEVVLAPTGRRMRRESRLLTDGAWQLPDPDQYLLECVEVWERLHGNRISIPFREPVAAKDAPGYFDIVKKPMDMRTVKEMLQDGRIATPDAFYREMKLICSNALLFNDEESDLYELALELKQLINKETRPIVTSWKEANGMEIEENESESETEKEKKRARGRPRGRPKKLKSKSKSKASSEKRKRGREDDGGRSKKRRMLRRSSRKDDGE